MKLNTKTKIENVLGKGSFDLVSDEINRIKELKQKRNAIILAHNYQTPDIYYGVADIAGDSLALAKDAEKVNADVILLSGVHFMAETAKIMNPNKRVIIPDMKAGCSLAESITPQDVKNLRDYYPGIPIVTYVNTSADVKAECDITCTSGNAVKIVEHVSKEYNSDKVIFLPDKFLANYVSKQTSVRIIGWEGTCEVHERFSGDQLKRFRQKNGNNIHVIAHPECPDDVLSEADFVGSTKNMVDYVHQKEPKRVLLLTECSMGDNVKAEAPKTEFLRMCQLCPHMKQNNLTKIRKSLENMNNEIIIDDNTLLRARKAVEKMLSV